MKKKIVFDKLNDFMYIYLERGHRFKRTNKEIFKDAVESYRRVGRWNRFLIKIGRYNDDFIGSLKFEVMQELDRSGQKMYVEGYSHGKTPATVAILKPSGLTPTANVDTLYKFLFKEYTQDIIVIDNIAKAMQADILFLPVINKLDKKQFNFLRKFVQGKGGIAISFGLLPIINQKGKRIKSRLDWLDMRDIKQSELTTITFNDGKNKQEITSEDPSLPLLATYPTDTGKNVRKFDAVSADIEGQDKNYPLIYEIRKGKGTFVFIGVNLSLSLFLSKDKIKEFLLTLCESYKLDKKHYNNSDFSMVEVPSVTLFVYEKKRWYGGIKSIYGFYCNGCDTYNNVATAFGKHAESVIRRTEGDVISMTVPCKKCKTIQRFGTAKYIDVPPSKYKKVLADWDKAGSYSEVMEGPYRLGKDGKVAGHDVEVSTEHPYTEKPKEKYKKKGKKKPPKLVIKK